MRFSSFVFTLFFALGAISLVTCDIETISAGDETETAEHVGETWRGLVVAEENRCSPYDQRDYPYPQSIEREIVELLGGVYGPYTGTCFASASQTDIEHIVARSEAHDSGLCARDQADRERFASDLLNLTLASPRVNRHQKRDKDAAEWLPGHNQCWFADHILEVRSAYDLTIDRLEAETLERVLSNCESVEMKPPPCHSAAQSE